MNKPDCYGNLKEHHSIKCAACDYKIRCIDSVLKSKCETESTACTHCEEQNNCEVDRDE